MRRSRSFLGMLRDVHAILAIKRSGMFATNWYIENNPDFAKSRFDSRIYGLATALGLKGLARYIASPIRHYVREGAAEGRNPSPAFDTMQYESQHPTLSVTGENPLFHWIRQSQSVVDGKSIDVRRARRLGHGFSIIMPTYNRRHCIGTAVDSVLNQSYPNWELIVCDDGSTDGAVAFLRERYAAEVEAGRMVILESGHGGVCAARNTALAAARNEWIAYLDSDNRLCNDYLAAFALAMEKNPGRRCFYCKAKVENSTREIGQPFDRRELERENFIDLGCFVHARSLFEEKGGFDPSLKRLVDWDLILGYTEEEEPCYISRPLFVYNDSQTGGRITTGSPVQPHMLAIYKKHGFFSGVKVTTIITSYNHERYIAQAIESALKQYGNFYHEILLADDASTDNTPLIVAKYASKYPDVIRNVSNSVNIGVSANLKRCFAAASGKYVAILEGDDYWLSSKKLWKQVDFLEEHPESTMVFSKLTVLNADTGKISFLERQRNLAEELTARDFLADENLNLIGNFSSCMFRAEVLKGMPSVLFDGRFNEISTAFYLDTLGKIGFISDALSVYRMHSHGIWTGASRAAQLESGIRVRQMALSVARDEYKQALKQKILHFKEIWGYASDAEGAPRRIGMRSDSAGRPQGGRGAFCKKILKRMRQSNLFDRDWYVANHSRKAMLGMSPERHYLEKGWRLGWDPSPRFSTLWYIGTYPDVRTNEINPLEHYLCKGVKGKRRICAAFPTRQDATFIKKLGDILAIIKIKASGRFATDWYISHYRDFREWRFKNRPYRIAKTLHLAILARFFASPIRHYVMTGAAELRNPSPSFNTKIYFINHPDCIRRGRNPLLDDIERAGKQKGALGAYIEMRLSRRRQRCLIMESGLLDADWYSRQHPELNGLSHDDLYEVFRRRGFRESSSYDFNASEYLMLNTDVASHGIQPLIHYVNSGRAQHRETSILEDERKPVFPAEASDLDVDFPAASPSWARVCVFASYSGDGLVAPYVLAYLRGLKEVCDQIIFVSDSPLRPGEMDKLRGLVVKVIARHHGQYDFRSYAIGIDWIRRLGHWDELEELTVCNDSCYGPFFPFSAQYGFMRKGLADFWGQTCLRNSGKVSRMFVQSYFMVFNGILLHSNTFAEFWGACLDVDMQCPVRMNTVTYREMEMTRKFSEAGFTFATWIPWEGTNFSNRSAVALEKYKMPLVKVKCMGDRHKDTNGFDSLRSIEDAMIRANPAMADMVIPHFEQRFDALQKSVAEGIFHVPSIHAHVSSFREKEADIAARLADGCKINVLIVTSGVMPLDLGETLFDVLSSDGRFEIHFVVSPDYNPQAGNLVEMLGERFGADAVLPTRHDDAYGTWTDPARRADIVVFDTPHEASNPFFSIRYSIGHRFLPVLCADETAFRRYGCRAFLMDGYALAWKILFRSQASADAWLGMPGAGNRQACVVDTGFPDVVRQWV